MLGWVSYAMGALLFGGFQFATFFHRPLGLETVCTRTAGGDANAMPSWRMVAYQGAENHILKGWEKQELLLIRTNIEPEPKAGDPECQVIPEMCEEIRGMLSELYLIDADGRVMRQNESDGTTRAQVLTPVRCGCPHRKRCRLSPRTVCHRQIWSGAGRQTRAAFPRTCTAGQH